MPPSAAAAVVPATSHDPLATALCAAELGEPSGGEPAPAQLVRELFDAMPQLRVSVPFATLQLLSRWSRDERPEVRASVAQALPWLVELYPERVEQILLALACDNWRKVRQAVTESLADALESSTNPWALIARWERHPERAREVLSAARKSLPPPLGR